MDDLGVLFARDLRSKHVPLAEIASKLGVNKSTISRRLSGPLPSKLPRKQRQPTAAIKTRRAAVSRLAETIVDKTMVQQARRKGQRGRLGVPRVVKITPFASPGQIAGELNRKGTACSLSTVRRDLIAMGFGAKKRPKAPRFFVGDTTRRLAFAKKYQKVLRSKKFLFSDEKYCKSNDHSSLWAWVRKGGRALPRRYEQWASKIHVWGLIGIGVKRLVVLPHKDRVNSDVYVKKCIKPSLSILRQPGLLFMQDGASAHTSGETMGKLKQLRVDVIPDWPPRSPDLNPIETLWAILGQRISKRAATSIEDLERITLEEWDKISQATVDRLVLGFEKRLRAVIETGGETIGKV
jgi:transposase